MNWWKNDNVLLVIGMLTLLLGFAIGRFVPATPYESFVEIALYAASVFFNGAYLKRFWQAQASRKTETGTAK